MEYQTKFKKRQYSCCSKKQPKQLIYSNPTPCQYYDQCPYYNIVKEQRRKYKTLKKQITLLYQYIGQLQRFSNDRLSYNSIDRSGSSQFYHSKQRLSNNNLQIPHRPIGKFRKVQKLQQAQASIETKDTPDYQYLIKTINESKSKQKKAKKNRRKNQFKIESDYFH